MPPKARTAGGLTVKWYQGYAKTLLAFNLPHLASAKNLAGFTIACQPPGQTPFYLQNHLQFQVPGNHAQNANEPPTASINAPFHKLRWLRVPGTFHGSNPPMDAYVYTVSPRFFDDSQSLLPIDPARNVAVTASVQPFRPPGLERAFTRGFILSQAFVRHSGKKTVLAPQAHALRFDTSAVAGTSNLRVRRPFPVPRSQRDRQGQRPKKAPRFASKAQLAASAG